MDDMLEKTERFLSRSIEELRTDLEERSRLHTDIMDTLDSRATKSALQRTGRSARGGNDNKSG